MTLQHQLLARGANALGEESKHPRTLAPSPLLRPLTYIYASRTLRHVEIMHLLQKNRSLWKNIACERQFFCIN